MWNVNSVNGKPRVFRPKYKPVPVLLKENPKWRLDLNATERHKAKWPPYKKCEIAMHVIPASVQVPECTPNRPKNLTEITNTHTTPSTKNSRSQKAKSDGRELNLKKIK